MSATRKSPKNASARKVSSAGWDLKSLRRRLEGPRAPRQALYRFGRRRRRRDVVHQFAIGPRVPVGNKGRIMRVRPEWRPDMLNGTEMLFRAGSDLDDVSQQSVGVRTIDAANFLDDVEIR